MRPALAQPLKVSELIDQFLGDYDLPPFLPGDLTVEAFNVKAKIPSAPKQTRAELLTSTRRPAMSAAAITRMAGAAGCGR